MGKQKNIGHLSTNDSLQHIKCLQTNVFEYLKESDNTIRSLSDESGLSHSTLLTLLYGTQKDCKLSTAITLAKTLGISVDELVGAGTIPEITLQNMRVCRTLPPNSLYLVRWFIKHQKTLYDRDLSNNKRIISVMETLCTNDGILKVTNNYSQIDISNLDPDKRNKVFFGIHLRCDFLMPFYSPYDIILIADDRKPLPREHVVVLIGNNLFIAKQENDKLYGLRDDKYRANVSEVSEVIGYITGVIPDHTEVGDR